MKLHWWDIWCDFPELLPEQNRKRLANSMTSAQKQQNIVDWAQTILNSHQPDKIFVSKKFFTLKFSWYKFILPIQTHINVFNDTCCKAKIKFLIFRYASLFSVTYVITWVRLTVFPSTRKLIRAPLWNYCRIDSSISCLKFLDQKSN